jgi:hypothetical protein
MQYRRVVALLIGVWLGGGIVMAWFGARSFANVHRVLNESNPAFALQTRPLGHENTRIVLRFHAAEQNRFLFQEWGYLQLVLGAFLFGYLLFGTLEGKFSLGIALAMIVITGVQCFGLTPVLGSTGKMLDFIPADAAAAERARFWLLHSAYLGCELLKFAAAALLLGLILRHGRSVDPVNKLDLVDKANHRHVNW